VEEDSKVAEEEDSKEVTTNKVKNLVVLLQVLGDAKSQLVHFFTHQAQIGPVINKAQILWWLLKTGILWWLLKLVAHLLLNNPRWVGVRKWVNNNSVLQGSVNLVKPVNT